MDEVKKNSLLIVDDENTNLKVLTHILGNEYTIFTAINGANAIEKAIEYRPDLILMDILMPEMNGYEVISLMKKHEKIKKIPVIFITGLSSDEDEEKGLTLEAADYIAKPFSSMIVKLRVRNQIQIINQMRTIEHLSLIDQLTNIPNRRSFDDRLQMEWKQAIREQTPISLLMLDLVFLKNLNDTYGHQHGDTVLKAAASVFSNSFKRPGDFAARWGGEEFVVLLPNTRYDEALEIAEKIRNDIENMQIPLENGSTAKVTVSIGVNSIIPGQDSSKDAFISGADKALYEANDAVRNRIKSALEN